MIDVLEYGKGVKRVTSCRKCKSILSYVPSDIFEQFLTHVDQAFSASYKTKQGDYIRCPVCGEPTMVSPDFDMTMETYELTTMIEVTDV